MSINIEDLKAMLSDCECMQPELLRLCGVLNEQNFWKWREYHRCASAKKELVFGQDDWFLDNGEALHFPRVSERDPELLVYTQSEEKGLRDLQTPVKVGRYLAKFYSDVLSAEEIKNIAQRHKDKYGTRKVLFADTADDIYHVYRNGPESCMSHEPSEYSSDIHPVEVYAHSNLAVAYFYNSNKRIAARTVVNTETKQWARVYGDGLLASLLEDLGYRSGGLAGGRMALERQGAYVVAPYLDGSHTEVSFHGDHLLIDDRYGEVCCDATSGLIRDCSGEECAVCTGRFSEEEMVLIPAAGISVCDGCDNEYFVDALNESGDTVRIRETSAFNTFDGTHFTSEVAASVDGYVITEIGEWHPRDECVLNFMTDELIHMDESIDIIVASTDDIEKFDSEAVVDDPHLFVTERGGTALDIIVYLDNDSDDKSVMEALSVRNMSEVVTIFELSCDVVELMLDQLRSLNLSGCTPRIIAAMMRDSDTWPSDETQHVASVASGIVNRIRRERFDRSMEYSDVEWFDIYYDNLEQMRGAK